MHPETCRDSSDGNFAVGTLITLPGSARWLSSALAGSLPSSVGKGQSHSTTAAIFTFCRFAVCQLLLLASWLECRKMRWRQACRACSELAERICFVRKIGWTSEPLRAQFPVLWAPDGCSGLQRSQVKGPRIPWRAKSQGAGLEIQADRFAIRLLIWQVRRQALLSNPSALSPPRSTGSRHLKIQEALQQCREECFYHGMDRCPASKLVAL